jgi:hypothetical protein
MTEGTWTSGGFVESNMGRGWYQLGIPDAALTSGRSVKIHLYGATNMVDTPILIDLVGYDNQSANVPADVMDFDSQGATLGLDSNGNLLVSVDGVYNAGDGASYPLLHFLALLSRKDAALATDAAGALGYLNYNFGSGAGTYSNQTDSQEALRDRGDASWITATGFSTHSAADVVTALGDGSTLTEAGGTGDHLTALATAANLATVAGYLDTEIASIISTLGTAGAGLTDIPKTGYKLASDGIDLILCADGVTLWKNATVHGAVVLMGVTAGAGTTSETFTKYGYVVTSTNDGTNRTATSVA